MTVGGVARETSTPVETGPRSAERELSAENARLRAELAAWHCSGVSDPSEARRLRLMAELGSNLLWLCQTGGQCNYVSPYWQTYTGAPTQVPTEIPWAAIAHPDDAAWVAAEWLGRAATGKPFEIEYRARRADGSYRKVELRARPIRAASGEISEWAVAHIELDSSRRPEAEVQRLTREALRASEERWQLALQGTGDGVWDWDLKTNSIYLSHRSRELLGFEGEETTEFAQRTDLVHPDDMDRARAAMQAHLRGETEAFSCEYRMRRKDGTYIWILGRGRVIERDEAGNPTRLVGTHKDIAERHRAEEALQNREALLREFITHTPAAIAMLDRNMCYIQASRRWLADYKLDDQNVVGRNHYEVFPDIPDRWKQIHQRVLGGAIESCDEDPFPRENGEIEWLQWEARPWRNANGEVGGLIFFTQVITERKQLGLKLQEQNRQLSRSNAELEQFAYVASHDLQEPLRAIAGCTQILERRYGGKLNSEADDLLAHIVEGVTRMKDLIAGLLSLSRVGSHRHVATEIDVKGVLDLAFKNLKASIVDCGAALSCGELPPVRGDATQVLQLFQNLIGNALKYQRAGSTPAVIIQGRLNDGVVEYSVTDNGIGIEAEYFERIFGVFQRLHTREDYPGTGIGLAICRKIVERHGGRIWVESEPGIGSTFRFTLPD